MYLTWRERLAIEPYLIDFSNWPYIASDSLPISKRHDFIRNQRLAAKILAGTTLTSVASELHVSVSMISRLMSRCLSGEDTESPSLTEGLIPSKHIKKHQRIQTIPTLTNSQGTTCAFSALLKDVPDLQIKLDAMIEAKLADKNYAQNLRPQWFHAEFKRALEEANWPKDHYPYTTTTIAYESVRNYLHQRFAEMLAERQIKQKTSRVTRACKPFDRAQKTMQIDEQILDINSNIHLILNDELIPLRLPRISLILGVDVSTNCYMGFTLALTQHPNQQEMLTLLDNITRPSPLPTLTTPGFNYSDGAGFPASMIDEFPISFGNVQLDNALMHLAYTVRSAICEQHTGTLNLGLPAAPKTRNWIESAFAYINQHATHRFSSTTGSHPKDPKKESLKNLKRVPSVSLQTLYEAIYIVLTKHNVTPQGRLGNATPLELFQKHCREHYLRYIPVQLRNRWQPFISRSTLPIKWMKHENRSPHVNFYGVRYTGSGLFKVVTKDKTVTIEFDRRDIRNLNAFSEQGQELGLLKAPLSWQRFSHSLATRQYINKLIKQHRFASNDPLAGYFRFLLENKGQPKQALQLMRVYQDFSSQNFGMSLLDTSSPETNIEPSEYTSNQEIKPWSINMANHKE